MPRACVFVDGENFRYSIVSLFSNFNKSDYLPKSANWAGLFDWVVGQVVIDGQRLRTYWYVIESIDFFPYDFPDADAETDKLYNVLAKHMPYKDELDSLGSAARIGRMEEMVKKLLDRQTIMNHRFAGWKTVQDGIATKHTAVEFRRAGAIRHNLFDNSLGQEKAVDVKLASDMIMLREIYDVAIIISGDQDYVPAVQVVKDSGKRVVNVAFLTRSGQLLPGGARRLNQVADESISLKYDDLRKYLGL